MQTLAEEETEISQRIESIEFTGMRDALRCSGFAGLVVILEHHHVANTAIRRGKLIPDWRRQ